MYNFIIAVLALLRRKEPGYAEIMNLFFSDHALLPITIGHGIWNNIRAIHVDEFNSYVEV